MEEDKEASARQGIRTLPTQHYIVLRYNDRQALDRDTIQSAG
jgi:hypothetical protein